jgi:glutamate formiminotransferase
VPLLECVPNVSEGRSEASIDRLAQAVQAPGVQLLDLSSDPDHNRTVLTLAGEPPALHRGLLRLYETAIERIDLALQEGVHPRIGAVDVVPFVPLLGAAMGEAVAAARKLAEEVARRFALPVYLYEEAATRRHTRSLPEIRRGGLPGLAARLADPAWVPDFGPARLHPSSGATVIGARFFLIAFNAVLATPEVEVARRIARAVRESSGGLAAVRAIGVLLRSRGRAQVSMNLLDYRRTSLWTALERVRREAQSLGTRVVEAEIVGLIPEAALAGAPADAQSLVELARQHGLERRLALAGRALAQGGEQPPGEAVERA